MNTEQVYELSLILVDAWTDANGLEKPSPFAAVRGCQWHRVWQRDPEAMRLVTDLPLDKYGLVLATIKNALTIMTDCGKDRYAEDLQ